MSLITETVQIPFPTPVVVIPDTVKVVSASLPIGNLIKPLNPCQCCHRRLMETYGVCNDCHFFCNGYCEFKKNVYIWVK